LRRDLLNLKVMGFNMVRFIWGAATPVQLDLCDEIWADGLRRVLCIMGDRQFAKMPERFDAAVSELIRRDRNHPSVVAWGLLNETNDGPTFQHAAAMLPLIPFARSRPHGVAQQRPMGQAPSSHGVVESARHGALARGPAG
jgi:beta-galactosidase/beta-glucuronidase